MRTLIALVIGLLCANVLGAAERFVPAQHATIQAAISAATPGDTIQVAAGVYVEDLNIDRYIILRGEGQGADGSVIRGTVTVAASGLAPGYPLELRDLRIEGTGGNGVAFAGTTSQLLFRDMTVTHATGDQDSQAFNISGSSVTNLSLEGVTASFFYSALRVSTDGVCSNLSIRNSHFDNNAHAINIYARNGTPDNAPSVNNVNIYKTTFRNNKFKAIYTEKFNNVTISHCEFDSNGVYGGHWNTTVSDNANAIDLNLKYGVYSNFRLIGNHFNNNAGDANPTKGVALTLKARDDGGYGGHPASLNGLEVRGNTFTNNSFVDVRFGESGKLSAATSNVVVLNNSFIGSATNTAIDNQSLANIDARGNYFGTADGSAANGGSGADVTIGVGCGAVDSTNHRSETDHDTTVVGYQINRFVDDDWAAIGVGLDPDGAGPATAMGFDAFGSIIDALTVASVGDTVLVMNGTYAHFQVLVATNALTIRGESRAGVRIIPAAVDSKDENPQAGTIVLGFVVGADDVTIANLTIDGEGNNTALGQPATDNNFRVGIVNYPMTLSHGTSVVDCEIRACVYDGLAIGTFSPLLGRSLGINIDGNTVSDVTLAHGISACGEGSVTNNTIDNVGAVALSGNFRGTGIQLEAGPLTVSGNTITNFSNLGIGNNASSLPAPHVYVIQGNSISQIQNGNFNQGSFGIRIASGDAGTKIGGSAAGQGNTIDLSANDTSLRRWGIHLAYSGDDIAGSVEVSGNTITMAGEGTGMLFHHNEDAANPIIVSGNTLTSSGATSVGAWQGFGILVNDDGDMFFDGYDEDSANYVILSGNDVSGFVVGVAANRVGTDPVGGRATELTLREFNHLHQNTTGLLALDIDGSTNGYRASVTIEASGLISEQNGTGILVDGATLSAAQIAVLDNTLLGVSIVNDGQVTALGDSDIKGNPTGIHVTSLAVQGAMLNNDFSGSTNFGINNLSGNLLNASSSYWGDLSGPTHASNPAGTGVVVSGDVTFVPFAGFDPVAPFFSNTAPASINAQQTYTHTVTFGGTPLPTLSVTGLPAWLLYDGSGHLSGTPSVGDTGLSSEIALRAANGFGPDAVQIFQINVISVAPMITSTAPTSAGVNTLYSYTITTSGVPAATVAVMGLPAWLSFNGSNLISGTPQLGDIGASPMITVSASNGVSPQATQSFQITVSGEPAGISSIPSSIAAAESPYIYKIVATGSPTPVLSVVNLPTWLTFDNIDTISGTPAIADAGDQGVITVTASNGVGAPTMQTFSLTVHAFPPSVSTAPPELATVDQVFTYVIVANGIPTPSVIVSGLPAWLTFDGTATISGSPPASARGATELISIMIANGVNPPVVQEFSIVVNDPNYVEPSGSSCSLANSAGSGWWLLALLAWALATLWRRRKTGSRA